LNIGGRKQPEALAALALRDAHRAVPRSDIRLEWVGESYYLGIVEYSTLAPGDEPVFTFDTSGRSAHVVTSGPKPPAAARPSRLGRTVIGTPPRSKRRRPPRATS
jgi:hypothetical protein